MISVLLTTVAIANWQSDPVVTGQSTAIVVSGLRCRPVY